MKSTKIYPNFREYYLYIKKEFDDGMTLGAVLQKYNTSVAMLKSQFELYNIEFPTFLKDRPKKVLSESFIKSVIDYKSKFNVGYKRCAHTLKLHGQECCQDDVRQVYDYKDLWKNSDYVQEKPHPNRFVVRYAGQLWHSDLHFVDIKQEDNTIKRFYLIAFIDDRTLYVVHNEMFDRKTAENCCNALINTIKKTPKPHMLTLDNGTEFKASFDSHCKDLSIEIHLTHAYTPQENGKIERFWSTLSTSIFDWNNVDDVVNEYNHYWPHSALKHLTGNDMTPFEAWSSMLHYEGHEDLDIIYE